MVGGGGVSLMGLGWEGGGRNLWRGTCGGEERRRGTNLLASGAARGVGGLSISARVCGRGRTLFVGGFLWWA